MYGLSNNLVLNSISYHTITYQNVSDHFVSFLSLKKYIILVSCSLFVHLKRLKNRMNYTVRAGVLQQNYGT